MSSSSNSSLGHPLLEREITTMDEGSSFSFDRETRKVNEFVVAFKICRDGLIALPCSLSDRGFMVPEASEEYMLGQLDYKAFRKNVRLVVRLPSKKKKTGARSSSSTPL
ncbi:hypothetical protein LR48_Vigan04g063400 [Vigna angularis]|nr:hypothetical protein LR48_Vigan04g063400 [Vigna angularis]